MIAYFKGHKDSVVINEYLNGLQEDSNDFQVIYCLRKMGESFVEGSLSMESVYNYSRFIPASQQVEAFIKQMKCYTFYTAICNIALNKDLTSFEQSIKNEIENPTFSKPVPTVGKFAVFKYKLERI